LVARPLAIYVSINPFGTAAAAILDVILVFGINTIEKWSPLNLNIFRKKVCHDHSFSI
jgi:hypothetical protein